MRPTNRPVIESKLFVATFQRNRCLPYFSGGHVDDLRLTIVLKKQSIALAPLLRLLFCLFLSTGTSAVGVSHGADTCPAAPGPVDAQSCNPAVVSYLVRDEKGKLLDEVALKSICEQLPKSIGDARIYAGEVSFSADGKTFYRPESLDWEKGRKVPSLHFGNSEACAMHLAEVTLSYHNKMMRLIFNIDITRTQSDRRPVVDARPFQEGTFRLDLGGRQPEADQMISAKRWKKGLEKTQRNLPGGPKPAGVSRW